MDRLREIQICNTNALDDEESKRILEDSPQNKMLDRIILL